MSKIETLLNKHESSLTNILVTNLLTHAAGYLLSGGKSRVQYNGRNYYGSTDIMTDLNRIFSNNVSINGIIGIILKGASGKLKTYLINLLIEYLTGRGHDRSSVQAMMGNHSQYIERGY